MTASKWFKFGRSSSLSDVKHFTLVLVLLSILDNIVLCNGMQRESRKLFGGYRITPSFCKATRAAKYNRGNTICMFNHECVQRGGEVVGACMDGFLFGACCQLKTEAQSHIPKGPGVVMTSYLDYPESDPDSDDYESDQQLSWHNSFKPIVTPGYTPGDKAQTTKASTEKTFEMELPGSTESSQSELISEGLSQITNTLLDTPPKENNIIIMRPKPEAVYTHSTINHGSADTILLHSNGSEVDNIARPSDFNVHISSMQTKPTVVPNTMTSTSTTPQTVSTHHPVFSKPVFKPKPKPQKVASTTEKFVPVQTVTKINELSSINSIIQMLNESTPSLSKGDGTTTPSPPETKSSPSPTATVAPVSYSSGYPSTYISTGHYVTLKPSSYPSVSVHSSSTAGYATTPKPSYATTSSKPSFATTSKPIYVSSAKPTYATSHKPTKYTPQPNKKPSSTVKPVSNTAKPGTGKPGTIKPFISSLKPILNSVRPKPSTSKPYVSSAKPSYTSPQPSQSTSQAIDAFNRYPTNPENFGESVTTFSYVSSTTTRKPPSTSYVYSNKPTRRPVTSQSSLIPSYDIAPDTFSSVTPTVIVLNGFQSTKAPLKEPEFVEISQEPFKKPVNQITVNNHIESTNNIFMNKPQQYDRPSSPTVVITPKPSPTTTSYPARPHKPTNSVSISSFYTTSSVDDYSDSLYSGTTNKPEMQTSPDDLINFPPVRNPMLNATGSNPSLYNTSISLSDNDLEVLHDVEFTTPTWQEDDKLNEKMNLFVNKIVGSLQGTFQELHDIVILDKKPNSTLATRTTTSKPSKKTPATTRRPATTTKRPLKATTTKKPLKTTKKPTKLTTVARKPTTTAAPPTTTPKKPETTTKKSKPIRKATTTQATSTATDSEDVTTESAPTANDNGIDYNDKNLCGVRPLVKSGRIVGGKNARFGEWPWQVLVRESTWLGLFTKNKCGGVLITSRFVTTAAHCQPGFLASLVAVFGENDISGDLEPRRPVSRNVRRVIVHRQYDAATFENDLALLELDTPVKFDAHIVPICMPPDDAEFTGRLATVTGWGRLKYGGGVPAVLQVVQVPVIENSMCQEMFQKAGHTKIILNSFLCAGYANGQKDSCEGDSGGPLVTQRDDGRWQLAGTVSHGIKCAAPYLPGVYMRTTFYKPWLRSITGVH